MATRAVLAELASRYQATTGQPVDAQAAGGVEVAERVREGELMDVVVLAGNVIDALIAEGKLLDGSRVDVVQSAVAVAVGAGSPRPDLGSEESLKDAVLNARSLSYSTGPSGTHLERIFERWGIFDEIRDRVVVPRPGIPVATLVADGTAAIGFQQLSELMNRSGVEVVGVLPPAIQCVTVFAGGVGAACDRPAAARDLLAYLASPSSADFKRRYGLEPA